MIHPGIKTEPAGIRQDEAGAGFQASESAAGSSPENRASYLAGIDLDGTLLNDRKCITDRTRALIHEATALGCEIVPVTGRPFTGLPAEILRIADIHYAITNDGTMIHRLKADRGIFKEAAAPAFGNLCAGPEALRYQEPIQSHTLDRETCLAVMDAIGWDIQSAGCATVCEIFANGTGYETADSLNTLISHVRSHYLADYYKKSRKPVDDIPRLANELLSGPGINMISAQFASTEDCDAAVQGLEQIDGVNAARLSIRDIEIYGAEAGKGNALLELASFLGIPHEHTIAVADGGNDLPMMDAAAYSVAMGNAREDVLSRASLIAADNNHDGAMEAVMSLLTPLTSHI
jgi:hydroxymethylpyrimidine pyrophosphatase-like HAD family hydrolase